MGLSLKSQIKSLLSEKVAQQKNLRIDVIKYELSKPYFKPEVQWIKIEFSKAEEVNSDFVYDENLAPDLGHHYIPPCSQLTYEADLQIAKEIIFELCQKTTNQCMPTIF